MILIEDYRDLRRYSAPCGINREQEYLGKDVVVTTTSGRSYSGVLVESGADTVTLALRKRSDRSGKRVVITKAHIVAIETALE